MIYYMNMKKINEIVGDNIAQLRKNLELTQAQLGELCGVEYGTVQRWENGKTWPKPEIVEKLCSIFKVRPSDLYDTGRDSHSRVPNLDDKINKAIEALANLRDNQGQSNEQFSEVLAVFHKLPFKFQDLVLHSILDYAEVEGIASKEEFDDEYNRIKHFQSALKKHS